MKLTGKVAVITGGNSGIGLATAQEFKAQGAEVVIFGRTQKTLEDAIPGNGLANHGKERPRLRAILAPARRQVNAKG